MTKADAAFCGRREGSDQGRREGKGDEKKTGRRSWGREKMVMTKMSIRIFAKAERSQKGCSQDARSAERCSGAMQRQEPEADAAADGRQRGEGSRDKNSGDEWRREGECEVAAAAGGGAVLLFRCRGLLSFWCCDCPRAAVEDVVEVREVTFPTVGPAQ